MKVFIPIRHGVVGAAVISTLCIWRAGSFGEARHTISIIGAIALVIASLYLLRSRWTRYGSSVFSTCFNVPRKVRFLSLNGEFLDETSKITTAEPQ